MQNELGSIRKDNRKFGIQSDAIKRQDNMNIDMFRKIKVDDIPGGEDTIMMIVKETIQKEIGNLDALKKLTISSDGELYYDGERFVKEKEIFAN